MSVMAERENAGKLYRSPDVREQDRFTQVEEVDYGDEPIVDKYDMLILFRLAEDQTFKSMNDANKVTWGEIKSIWRPCLAGSEKAKEMVEEALKQQWVKRVRTAPSDIDTIMWGAFVSMARATIIDTLLGKAGLQLEISVDDAGLLYCRLRAPVKLLEYQAAVDDYRLQYKGAIDPGSEQFWNREVNKLVIAEDEEERAKVNNKMIVKRVAVEIDEEAKVNILYLPRFLSISL